MFGMNKPELKEYNLSEDELSKLQYAKVTTRNGLIWLKLTPQNTPIAVANFAFLVNDGYYNGLKFHRVIDGFMAQGGCPDGTGAGGPGWSIACETSAPGQVHTRGTLSMAHAGPNTGGSQFFITFVATPHLDGGHTVFGGIEDADENSFTALDSIAQGDPIEKIEIKESRN